jgi:hypothetical protein
MIKRILQFLFFVLLCSTAFGQTEYNAIATAYVTTTISQNVVFNSTMQQGGTFTFSVLAHNGGGRAGQSDTANVKIEFYNSGGTLITQAATSYNANLPNPQNVCGNPCIDTSVPWSTLTISSTLSSTQAAQVAYARVSMYGVDGSFWAGDYGPWYRAPTFQQNGGSNLTYNPEFGPYNGVTAQGWTSSPGFGACQGAWGGSNACIVNSDGVPGTSTTGLVANANGGGPSPTGGTTSGTPGGYNNTMTTTNAGTGATAGAPPAPTVTGTTVSYTIRSVITSPGVTSTYRTPVTTTNYSDGTSTSTNGTETLYSTVVASNVVTNKIVNGVLTVYTTPITTTTLASNNSKTVTANGPVTETTQPVQRGLNMKVWRYDYHTYTCGWLGCLQNIGSWTWQNPNMNANQYGNPVNSGITTSGMYVPTNSSMPNNDSGFGYADGTVINYTGTITAPITTAHPAGSVYRLYFHNQSDDGFVLNVNGQGVIFNNSNWQLQAVIGSNDSGWIDVVAGQTYNIDAWYWNTEGGWGLRLYWDYGNGAQLIPNSAFTTGSIVESNTIDITGVSYSNSSVVNVSGSTVALYPEYVTIGSGTPGEMTFGTSSGPTLPQQTKIDAWTNKTVSDGNKIYIDQVSGNNNAVTIDQTGNKNVIKGPSSDYAKIQGNSNSITINQGVTGTGQNEVNFSVIGDSNTLNINQARTTQGSAIGTNGHYKAVDINGSNNTLTTQQSNTGGVGGHYMETTINGNTNNVTARQTDNGNKIMFNSVTGNNNTVEAIQKGTGQHYLENKLTGNNNSVSAVQEGNIANRATLDLTNAGGPASVILQQNGGQNVSVTTSCATAGGCAPITVRQGY